MKSSTILGLGIAAGIVVWQLAPELHPLARGLTALFVGVMPAFSIIQAKAVAHLPELPSRQKLYLGTILGLWGMAFATALVSSEARIDPRLLGVAPLPWPQFAVWTVFGLLGVASLILAFKALGMAETPMIHHLIPQTIPEKVVYVGVSMTAGICEEMIFRGFLIATLTVATGSVPVAVLISAAVFGISHAHQDAAGALRAGLLGLVLTVPLLATGSLYPGIAAHALVDLLAGLWFSKWLLRS